MSKDFAAALDRVLVHEGGYVNHPKDPGGATNKGVTQRVYDLHRKGKGQKPRSVKSIELAEVREIYRKRYWDVIAGDRLPAGVSYVVFDGAVNSGPGQSGKWLQRALGSHYDGKIDGRVGESTIAAVDRHPNHDVLIVAIIDRRMAFLRSLRTWPTFGKGWTARLDGVRRIGQAWATGASAPKVTFVPEGNAKATLDAAPAMPAKGPADALAGGGVISTVIAQATEQLTPLSGIEAIAKIVAVLTAVGVVVTIGAMGWRFYAQRREARLRDTLDIPAVPA